MGFSDVDSDNKPQSFQQTYESKRQMLRMELQQKEDEMRQQFVIRVKEKETELKEAEKEVSLFSQLLKSLLSPDSLATPFYYFPRHSLTVNHFLCNARPIRYIN